MKQNMCGDWKVGDRIGSGGQGNVYRTDDKSGKTHAIKRVKIKTSDKKKIERIKREIQIIKQLKDAPNIIRIYDDNTQSLDENSVTSQEVYYVMDIAPYGSLKDNDFYLNDIELSLTLFREILIGVGAAHKVGVVHRDLKPENILLYPTQKSIAVADFGLGRLTAEVEGDNITESDEILGPRYFMSPEQYKDPSKADERSDMYSLGKVLYYMLTGKGKVFREEIGDLSKDFTGTNPYLPLIQENLLNKMVIEDPKKRFGDVDEIIESVDDILEKIATNSKRIIKKNRDEFSFYDALMESRRQEYIDDFSKDLSVNMMVIGWIADELMRKKKQAQLVKLKDELLSKNPRGKARAAVEATFLYIEKPEDLSKHENGKYSFASYRLAEYFENADSHEQAHRHIVSALAKEADISLKLRYLLLFSTICISCKCSEAHDFEKRLIDLLRASSDSGTKARLYKMLGDHYIKNNDKPQGLRFMEAYLAIKPYDNDVRFKCAWEYSEMKQLPLAFHHYALHEKTAKDPSDLVDNNTGVLYGDINANIKALAAYKKSYERGNTLAGSNIASKYLSIGLVDEAQKILRQIIADHPDGDYNERVDQVLASISRQKETEEDQVKKMHEEGGAINHHNNESISRLSGELNGWIGFWNIAGMPIIEIKQTPDGTRAFTRNKDAKELSITFEGNVASVDKLEMSYTTYNFGVLYMTDEDHVTGYVLKDGGDYKELAGERIKDIQTFDQTRTGSLTAMIESAKISLTGR